MLVTDSKHKSIAVYTLCTLRIQNIYTDLCDPKRSHPDAEVCVKCAVCSVGVAYYN